MGTAVQPPQVGGPSRRSGGRDLVSGNSGEQKLFGAKLSPYFPARKDGPKVTAWTVLLSAETGDPILLCDSLALTTERTAGTTALALELLMPASAKAARDYRCRERSGWRIFVTPAAVHEWSQIQLYSRTIDRKSSCR